MKKIKFRLLKYVGKNETLYGYQRKRFGLWFTRKYSPGMDSIATLMFTSEEAAIQAIKAETIYKPEKIEMIQYPTLTIYNG